MLGQLTRHICLSVILFISLSGRAQSAVDSLKNRLAQADNLPDSISLLYKIYDNSSNSLKDKTLDELYKLAIRRADYPTVYNIIRLSADHYASNDSMQQVLIARTKKLPDSSEKQSTLVYLDVISTSNLARTLSKDHQEAKLHEYLSQHKRSVEFDTYRRIEYLFRLCTFLSVVTEGELLTDYIRELQTLIDSLPPDKLALRRLFYSRAANIYLSNGMITEAVETNKTLLKILNKIDEQNTPSYRLTVNFDEMEAITYYRLLQCHEVLNETDIDNYYTNATSLFDQLYNRASLSDKRPKLTIFYLMAKKRYDEVIPLITEQLKCNKNTSIEKLYLVDALVKATEVYGNKENQLMALELSNELLKNRIHSKATESYKDLQIIYDVNDLRQANAELQLTNQQIEIGRHKEQLRYAIIGVIILVILLVIIYSLYRRSKKLSSNLITANDMIIEERDALQRTQKDLIKARDKAKLANLKKTDFVNNMGHEIRTPLEAIVEYSGLIAECADADGNDDNDHIKQYADIVTLNADLLISLVNDVLELPTLENAKASLHITKGSVQKMCNIAINNVRNHIKPVKITFINEGQPDTSIKTDPHRVEQVLIILLINTAKYTDNGSITLQYTITNTRDKIIFSITSTGTVIPSEIEEFIFSRPENPESDICNNSISLYICRLLAEVLGGSLTIDKAYCSGIKFIFTIPVS